MTTSEQLKIYASIIGYGGAAKFDEIRNETKFTTRNLISILNEMVEFGSLNCDKDFLLYTIDNKTMSKIYDIVKEPKC